MEQNSKKLKLIVDLDSDEELRSYVKQMIDDQVKSILRGELKDFIKKRVAEIIVDKKISDSTISHVVNIIVEKEVKNSISNITKGSRTYFSLDGYIKSEIDRKIDFAIKEALVKVDLESIMRKRAEKIVEQAFDNMIKKGN